MKISSSLVCNLRPLFFLAAVTLLLSFASVASAQDNERIVTAFYVNPAALFTTTGTSTSSTAVPSDTAPVSAPQSATGTSNIPQEQKSPEEIENERKNDELKQYLLRKYNVSKGEISLRLEHTSYGPKGHLNLSGKFMTNSAPKFEGPAANKEDKIDRARAIANAFLKDEMVLLGISTPDELKEIRIRGDELGYTFLRYQRYINGLPLEQSIIQIDVGPEDKITWVNGDILPITPELYEAVQKETLPENAIRVIAEQTLREVGFDADKDPAIGKYMKIEKVALSTPPYVAWKVESTWFILIDAFTGNVLKKRSNIRN